MQSRDEVIDPWPPTQPLDIVVKSAGEGMDSGKGTSMSQYQSLRKAVGAEEVLTTSQVGASQVTTSGSKKDWE